MATMTIRCDEADKKAASEVAAYYGFDLSSVTRALWKQMARTHRIPLDFGNEEPNEESLASIKEAEDIIAQGGTGESYDSGRAVLDAALEDDKRMDASSDNEKFDTPQDLFKALGI